MYATTISLAPPPPKRAAPRKRITALPGFAAGTLLRTIAGTCAIEQIMAGDLLVDADGQIVELRSIQSYRAEASELVEITPPAMGLGLAPALRNSSLVVGAGQKLGMRDWRTDLLYGKPAMTLAKSLIDCVLVHQPLSGATLYRLGFDTDCVVIANGLPALVHMPDA